MRPRCGEARGHFFPLPPPPLKTDQAAQFEALYQSDESIFLLLGHCTVTTFTCQSVNSGIYEKIA